MKINNTRGSVAASSERTKSDNVGKRNGGEQEKDSNGQTGTAAVVTGEEVQAAAPPLLGLERAPENTRLIKRKKCC